MNPPPSDDLAALLRAAEGSASRGLDCPSSAALWDAARGALPASTTRDLLAHTAACPACSEEWHVAVTLSREAGQTRSASSTSRRSRPVGWLLAAAAAIAGAALLLPLQERPIRAPAGSRDSAAGPTIRPLIEDDGVLPRHAFVLRWTPGPPGTTYDLEVATEDLRPLHVVADLTASEALVPAESLVAVPAGGRIVWRVGASFPDGRFVRSPAFLARPGESP